MRLGIDVDDAQVFRDLLDMGVRADRMRPLLTDLADDYHDLSRAKFASEGKPRWKPLSPSTVAARGGAHPILVDSGDLRDSLTQPGAKGSIRQITSDEMTVGTDLFYARFLHAGTKRMPRRRLTTLTKAVKLRWSGSISAFVVRGERL